MVRGLYKNSSLDDDLDRVLGGMDLMSRTTFYFQKPNISISFHVKVNNIF